MLISYLQYCCFNNIKPYRGMYKHCCYVVALCCFQIYFYYFGISLIYYTVTTKVTGCFSFTDDIFPSEFKQAIENDYVNISTYHLGVKTDAAFKKWIVDGKFLPFCSSHQDKYVYCHSKHANCSSISCVHCGISIALR